MTELSGHVHALVLPHHPLVLQVALVAHQHHGHLLAVLHPEYLLPEVLQVIESGLSRDAVDQDEALAVLHVEISHGGELLRTGGVEDLQHALLPLHLHLLPVAVLYGRVVPGMVIISINFIITVSLLLLHEDPLYELHGEGGLAHAAAAEHHDLVLTHARLLVPGLKMAHKL